MRDIILIVAVGQGIQTSDNKSSISARDGLNVSGEDLHDMYGLARVTGWEPYDLYDLPRASRVEPALYIYRSRTASPLRKLLHTP